MLLCCSMDIILKKVVWTASCYHTVAHQPVGICELTRHIETLAKNSLFCVLGIKWGGGGPVNTVF